MAEFAVAKQTSVPQNLQITLSDRKEVQLAVEFARKRESELKELWQRVRNMGIWQRFLDSRVPQKANHFFHFINLNLSNREEIIQEIKKYLEFYHYMIEVADKADISFKTDEERNNPYVIIIKLNEELNSLFELAQVGTETTSSCTLHKMYKEFLAKQSELENKIRRLECVFLKQQFLAQSEKRQLRIDAVRKEAEDAAMHREKLCAEMEEQASILVKQNAELRGIIAETSWKLEHFLKMAEQGKIEVKHGHEMNLQ